MNGVWLALGVTAAFAAVSARRSPLDPTTEQAVQDALDIWRSFRHPKQQERAVVALSECFDLLGYGSTRVVFALDEHHVLKLPLRDWACVNRQEAERWTRASPALRRWYVPVLAADRRGHWLVMARAFPAQGRVPTEALQAARDALRALPDSPTDRNPGNFGEHEGQLKLLDYGEP